MSGYDREAFLRHVIAAGNDISPNSYLGGAVPDHEVPDDFRVFVNDLVDHGLIEDTMSRGWGATMPARCRVTPYGRQTTGV